MDLLDVFLGGLLTSELEQWGIDHHFAEVIANHMESPGTRAYTAAEARALFPVPSARVDTRITAYDLRVGRRAFLPTWTWSLVPASLGWFHMVSGTK